jgi:hypothetical protein
MNVNHSTRGSRRGFTLVEAVAAMSVLVAVGSVSSTIVYSAVNGGRAAYASCQLNEEISSAMERIVHELRRVGLNSSAGSTAPNITAVTAGSIGFGTSSSFGLSGTTLNFVDSGASAVALLTGVSAFSVSCYDESNAALGASLSGSTCYPIRRVQISITCTRDGVSETLTTRVFVRGAMSGGVP